MESGKEDFNQFGVSVASLNMLMGRSQERRFPRVMGSGIALEEMVITLGLVSTCGAFGILLWRAMVDCLTSGLVPEAQLEDEDSELVTVVEDMREGIPMDGFDGGLGPEEMSMHV
jgi:hypothetical protein